MSDTKNHTHDHNPPKPHKASGTMITTITPPAGNDLRLNIREVYRSRDGATLRGDITGENGLRHLVLFSMSEGSLPPADYGYPSDKISDLRYLTIKNGRETEYPAASGFLIIEKNTLAPTPHISGEVQFQTAEVNGISYRVKTIFEIEGLD